MKTYPFLVLREGLLLYGGSRAFDGTAFELAIEMKEEIEKRGPEAYNPNVDNSPELFTVLAGKEAKLWTWEREFKTLPPVAKELISMACKEILSDDSLKCQNNVKRTLLIAKKRIHDAGLSTPCGRCGGSGHYSYNQRDATRCFGCGGAKWRIPENKAHLKKIAKHFEAKH